MRSRKAEAAWARSLMDSAIRATLVGIGTFVPALPIDKEKDVQRFLLALEASEDIPFALVLMLSQLLVIRDVFGYRLQELSKLFPTGVTSVKDP